MLKQVQTIINAQKQVFSNEKYIALSVALFFVFGYVFIYITSIPGQSLESWYFSVMDLTKYFVFISSILLALIATTQVYIYKNFKFNTKTAGATGSGVVAFTSGTITTLCCSPVLLTSLGLIGFGWTILKYQPQLFAISLILLIGSLYYSSKVIDCRECQVNLHLAGKRGVRP